MLLGALVDAGADLELIRRSVDAVIPESVRLGCVEVSRSGLRAVHLDVEVIADDPPHRSWQTIRGMLTDAALPAAVRDTALAVFGRLAQAEGTVHGVDADEVHFHEVGALDSIADIVGVSAAVHQLGITDLTAGPVAVGSGTVRTSHGEMPIPVPAVTELAVGWQILAGGKGELATPTGMALLSTLGSYGELPPMTVTATGTGAGSRDTPGRANVTRVVLGAAPRALDETTLDETKLDETALDETIETLAVLETNVDDLDPRLWPGVLEQLLSNGAADAWLTPILMKKGRPAHTLSVLCQADLVDRLRAVIYAETSTLGIRQRMERRAALARDFTTVEVDGLPVAIKLAHRNGTIVRVTPEFEDVAAAALRLSRPTADVLAAAIQAAARSGFVRGARWPR